MPPTCLKGSLICFVLISISFSRLWLTDSRSPHLSSSIIHPQLSLLSIFVKTIEAPHNWELLYKLGVANFVDRNRKLFSGISAFLLSLVPWTQVSKSRSLLLMVKPNVFLVAIGLGALLHLTLLVFNYIAVRSLSVVTGGSKSVFSREENANALILIASQKTLPVMVAVIEPLRGAFGESGLLVLPCIAAHLIQIIVDSFLVNFMRHNPDNIKVA